MPVTEGLIFMYEYVCVYVSLCAACVVRYLRRPEEGTEALGTEATGTASCLVPILGTKPWVFCKSTECS